MILPSNTFHLVSLGCAKNTVDSDSMAQLLLRDGYRAVEDRAKAKVLIVNTCGFIGPAKQESLDVLRELAEGKRDDQLLIAAGCLTQRYGVEVAKQVPGVDGILGTRRWMDIVEFTERLRANKHPEPQYHLPEEASVAGRGERGARRVSVAGASAYVKIADGCRRPCAFCSIPRIKGTAVSRPPEAVINEARYLAGHGVREVILIAQDLTDYGYDLGLQDGLPNLLESICDAAPELKWIRLMYAYPGAVGERLIEVMASRPQIVHYVDIPLQHGHPDVLKRMRRPANIDWVYRTVARIRAAMPDVAIRTTFIVGYPGETEEHFEGLLQFLRDLQFDRVGDFQYSFEPEIPSAQQDRHVPEEATQDPHELLMQAQQAISLKRNQAQVGRTLDVLIEGQGDGLTLGRTYRDAPEIDGMVILEGEAPLGEFVPVKIDGAMTYDLAVHVEAADPMVIRLTPRQQ